MYDTGEGVTQDYRESVKWYRRAAEQGYDVAQYNLGLMYGRGGGEDKNSNQGVSSASALTTTGNITDELLALLRIGASSRLS